MSFQSNDDGAGYGVEGTSQNKTGVVGSSNSGEGVAAFSQTGIGAFAWSENSVGLTGYSGPKPILAVGESFPAKPSTNAGVYGYSLGKNAAGVVGQNVSEDSYGVLGTSNNGTGVFGISSNGSGMHGETNSTTNAAVTGLALNPSSNIAAVWGEHRGNGPGVYGQCDGNAAGIFGQSGGGDGVFGLCTSNAHAGVSANNFSGGFGLWARGTPAGHFEGDVEITGTLTTPAAFRFIVTLANIYPPIPPNSPSTSGFGAIIDHPLINGDPSAILLVTPVASQQTVETPFQFAFATINTAVVYGIQSSATPKYPPVTNQWVLVTRGDLAQGSLEVGDTFNILVIRTK